MSSDWKNPAERPENSSVDFRKSPIVYMVTSYGTVVECDASLGYLTAKYKDRLGGPRRLWAMNSTTGLRTEVML